MIQNDGAKVFGAVGAVWIVAGYLIGKPTGNLDSLEAGAQPVQLLAEQLGEIYSFGKITGVLIGGSNCSGVLCVHGVYLLFYFLDLDTRMLGCSNT